MTATLPANVDMERWVLGSVVLESSALDTVRTALEVEDFSIEPHRRIWRRICELYDAGTGVDRISLYAELDRHHEAQSIGGLSYLVDLDEGLPRIPNLDRYVAIVKEKALRRRMILAAHQLANTAADETRPIEAVMESFGTTAVKMAESSRGSDDRPFSTHQMIETVGVENLLRPRRSRGVRLPWSELDRAVSGFRPEQMVVLMAETSRGKTSAALQVAAHAALEGKTPVIWTMEMSPEALFRRLVNQLSEVSGNPMQLTFEERHRQVDAVARLDEHPIYFDRHSRSVSSFCASVRQVRAQASVDLVIIDYLQLIRSQSRTNSRAQEVSNNSRALKLCAMDFRVPFLVLSQVDRGSVKGQGEINLHSAKESGDIENDADVLMWIKGAELARDHDTPVQMWVGKQREGAAGFGIDMVFRPQSQTFLEVAHD